MGVQPVLFQSAGQAAQLLIPGAYARIDFAPSFDGGASVNNAVILGDAAGGQPNVLYVFSSYAQAAATLKSGGLLNALWHAFNPGDNYSPQYVGAMRVNSATQAAFTSGNVTLTSADYGLANNRIQYQIVAGTVRGKQIQVQQDTNLFVQDNVLFPGFELQYVGTGSACTLSVNSTQLVVTATGDAANTFALDLVNTYKSVSDLAAYFASKASAFTFTVKPGAGVELNTNLDAQTTLDIKTAAKTCNLDLLAQTRAFQATPLIGANGVTIAAGSRTPLGLTAGWINLAGGSEGTYTLPDFANALNQLTTANVQLIGTSAEDAPTHALISAHCTAMNSVTGRNERQFIVGGAKGESVAQAVTRAQNLSTEFGALCYPGFFAFDQNGNTVLYSPAYYAAKEIGRQVALAVNEPATRKQVAHLGWEWSLQITHQDTCIAGGVWCGARTRDGRNINVRAVTTYQANNLQQNEFSIMREALFVNADLRTALDNAVIGHAMTQGILGLIDSIVTYKLNYYAQLGIFQATKNGPGYWDYQRTISGSVVTVTYQCYLTPPTNFVFVTAKMRIQSTMG